ncbi:FAD-binding oxidoreductase [Stenotrophomonas cyclobalanopsidis]|uniref:FAD-binding oxidoreductase n=1 Tax=Stenotrophomonas cyclobalanopsidis TaxID=2771362 RepID=A0ABQ6SXK1_9GAMM|nr:FAD-binding oxidoreductase [Stenotrophomonas cyclobalanopsidis]KAA8995042.1 FAD-binding oxidoreductase [Stenotrophomonas cyclobalanopsidis]
MTTRRAFIAGCAVATAASACNRRGAPVANDISQLEPTDVAGVRAVAETADLQAALQQHRGTVCVAGGRYSMGGQTSAAGALQLGLTPSHRLLRLDVARRAVRVQAGMRWRALQEWLDPHNLSVKVMQSFSNFTVGGSVSVNCHGRYVGSGSIASTVRALQVVLRSGEVVETSRTQHPELFAAVIGGYGLIGVVSEVELDLTDNDRMARHMERVALADYPQWFRENVASRSDALMHNADLIPPRFDAPVTVTWRRSTAALTDTRRLIPVGANYAHEQNMIWAVTELPGGPQLRESSLVKQQIAEPRVIHRNLEASLDVAALEPRTRAMSTYLLQEYFIPVRSFQAFATRMAAILQHHRVDALNVSIRHAPADTTALMKWADEEVFCFVLYHKQRRHPWGDTMATRWTRALIDAAVDCGGRYYLPYRPHATGEQFQRAYPQWNAFVERKRQYDPQMQLVNQLWQRYLAAP